MLNFNNIINSKVTDNFFQVKKLNSPHPNTLKNKLDVDSQGQQSNTDILIPKIQMKSKYDNQKFNYNSNITYLYDNSIKNKIKKRQKTPTPNKTEFESQNNKINSNLTIPYINSKNDNLIEQKHFIEEIHNPKFKREFNRTVLKKRNKIQNDYQDIRQNIKNNSKQDYNDKFNLNNFDTSIKKIDEFNLFTKNLRIKYSKVKRNIFQDDKMLKIQSEML